MLSRVISTLRPEEGGSSVGAGEIRGTLREEMSILTEPNSGNQIWVENIISQL